MTNMFISEHINNIEKGVKFCDRYNISYIISVDNRLNLINPPDLSYREKFRSMEVIARKIDGFVVDHPNCYLNNLGQLIVTFSPYDGELTEKEQIKLRRKGYDLRECGFDLYGHGTKTYVMAELVSPLDELPNHSTPSRIVPESTEDTSDDYHTILTLNKEYLVNELNRILTKMIVSAGLTNTTWVPRINNPCELVVVKCESMDERTVAE